MHVRKDRIAHTLLIGAHAVCGLVALATGIAILFRRPTPGVPSPLFRVYLGTLWLMVLFLVTVVALDWRTVPAGSKVLYGLLLLLALYVAWRGWSALQHRGHPVGDRRAGFIEDVGFTVIALFDGFVIISALDLGAPLWLVLVIAALGVLAGRYGVQRARGLADGGAHESPPATQ
jgi:hypothetical protein